MPRRPWTLVTGNLPPQRSPTFSSRDRVLRKRCAVGRAPRIDVRATRRDKLVRFVHACWPTLRVTSGIICQHSYNYRLDCGIASEGRSRSPAIAAAVLTSERFVQFGRAPPLDHARRCPDADAPARSVIATQGAA